MYMERYANVPLEWNRYSREVIFSILFVINVGAQIAIAKNSLSIILKLN